MRPNRICKQCGGKITNPYYNDVCPTCVRQAKRAANAIEIERRANRKITHCIVCGKKIIDGELLTHKGCAQLAKKAIMRAKDAVEQERLAELAFRVGLVKRRAHTIPLDTEGNPIYDEPSPGDA